MSTSHEKLMIVFEGVVRECKVLCQEFRIQAVIASSPSGWMNSGPSVDENVIGAFSFKEEC